MAKKGSYSLHYLKQEESAMRWLAEQGLTPEEIREFRWGQVDESDRSITIKRKVVHIRYDLAKDQMYRMEDLKEMRVSLKGTEQEEFFLRSKTPSFFWVFTEHPPKGWRREETREALFPLEAVEKLCRGQQSKRISPLTFIELCANIEVSKLNIHKTKSAEQIGMTGTVFEASN